MFKNSENFSFWSTGLSPEFFRLAQSKVKKTIQKKTKKICYRTLLGSDRTGMRDQDLAFEACAAQRGRALLVCRGSSRRAVRAHAAMVGVHLPSVRKAIVRAASPRPSFSCCCFCFLLLCFSARQQRIEQVLQLQPRNLRIYAC